MQNSAVSNKHNFITDFKRYSPLLINLSVRDIKIKYRRSFLGIAWSILNPLLTMLVLTTVFKMMLRIQIPNYASYYIVGFSIWSFFSESTSLAMSSIIGASALIKKVYVPKYMFPIEKCIFALINFAFSLIAVLVVMLIQGVYPTFTTLLAVIPMLYCFIFACGISLFLSAVTVYFRDIAHFYSVLLTLWMYLTPIIYNIELINSIESKSSVIKFVSKVIRYNPMTFYVTYMRDVMIYNNWLDHFLLYDLIMPYAWELHFFLLLWEHWFSRSVSQNSFCIFREAI